MTTSGSNANAAHLNVTSNNNYDIISDQYKLDDAKVNEKRAQRLATDNRSQVTGHSNVVSRRNQYGCDRNELQINKQHTIIQSVAN